MDLLGAFAFAIFIAAQVLAVIVVPKVRFDDACAQSSPRAIGEGPDHRAGLNLQGVT